MTIRHIIYILLFAYFLISCEQEENFTKIDERLKAAMERKSETGTLDFYQLPSSTDFSNIPQDPKNPISPAKIELGKLLFHETAFSTDGKFPNTLQSYSCASCHHAGAGFQAGIAQGIGEGGLGFGVQGESRMRNTLCEASLCDVQPVRSPTILNGAYQELMLWNGQFGATGLNTGTEAYWTEETPKAVNNLGFEGLETQAIAGLKVHRIAYSQEAIEDFGYKALFDNAFPNVAAEERYTIEQAGLAIAAYERTVMSNEAPFQQYLQGNLQAMSNEEKHGALLFFEDAQCVSCHTGPALNSMEFHALGVREFNQADVIHYNPEDPAQFGRFSFTEQDEDMYRFKVPQLYNLKGLEFFGHGASMRSIRQVINYKNLAIPENTSIPRERLSDQFVPLHLTDQEINHLTLFIENSLFDPNLERYVPETLPSGYCFPNNDPVSQEDLGCN